MKFSLFALTGFVASAFAAPLVAESAAQPVARAEITTVSDVTTVVQGLLITVTSHTAIINATLATQEGSVVGDLVTAELKAVVAAVSEVTTTLKGVDGTLTATVAEVQVLAGLVFSIVSEVVSTAKAILASLGISALLTGVYTDVVSILASLILTVEGDVSGVLVVVGNLINVSGLLSGVSGVLAGLPQALVSGLLGGL